MIEKWQCFLMYSLGVSAIFRPLNALAKISWLSSMKNIVNGSQLALVSAK